MPAEGLAPSAGMDNGDPDRASALLIHVGPEELVIRRRYEVASILNDMLVAVWFLIGSVFFLFANLVTIGTVLFIVGSAQLAIRPAIRLRRRVHLRRFHTPATETARDF